MLITMWVYNMLCDHKPAFVSSVEISSYKYWHIHFSFHQHSSRTASTNTSNIEFVTLLMRYALHDGDLIKLTFTLSTLSNLYQFHVDYISCCSLPSIASYPDSGEEPRYEAIQVYTYYNIWAKMLDLSLAFNQGHVACKTCYCTASCSHFEDDFA